MNTECKIESEGTVFRFYVTKRRCDNWTDAVIQVENKYIKYKTSNMFLEFGEMECMRDNLLDLINGKLHGIKKIEFVEPEIQIILKANDVYQAEYENHIFGEGYELRKDYVTAEFLLYIFSNGALTEQYYVMPLDMDEIEILVEYLSDMIEKLNG